MFFEHMKRIITSAFLFLAIVFAGNAQNLNTPYSMYGYGLISDHATSMQRQMGSVGYAMNSGRQINVMNPASYAAIDSLTFLFDLGGQVNMLWSKEDNKSRRSFGGGFDYVTMQFPITKYMGGSFGLLPYSSVGYAFGNDISHGAMSNQGSGGINQLYLGWSGKLGPVSIGVNASYDFGVITNDIFSATTSGTETKFQHVMKIEDWSANFGLQYTARLNRFHKVVFGLTYAPERKLHGESYATIQNTTLDSRADTLGMANLKNGYKIPESWGAGISYSFEKNYKLQLEADVTYQSWSKAAMPALHDLKKPTIVIAPGAQFNDRWRYAAGLEYIPDVRGSYLKRMTYRFGGYYAKDYIKVNDNNIEEYSVSGGLGFPTPEGKTMINLGIEWKHRQASPKKLITENYLNVTLGVNFNEVWFWKRKIR